MYSSSSQDYAYFPDSYLHQQQQQVPLSSYSSPMNYGHDPSQFMGSTHSHTSASGYFQMPHSNGSYGNMAMPPPPQFNDTAESLQRDFDQFMLDTAGSRDPLPSATHHSAQIVPDYRQHPYTTVHPNKLYGDGHKHRRGSRGGQQATLSGSGTESSSSSRSHSSESKPYSRTSLVAQSTGSRTSRKDEVVKKDAHTFPAQLAKVMKPGPLAPTGYLVVPQRIFYCGPTTFPVIEFMPWRWNILGHEALQKSSATYHHIENRDDKVLSHFQEIKIRIQWPGYSAQYPFEKRIGTKEGKIIRGDLVELVYKAVVEFVKMLKDMNAMVERRHPEWMIGHSGLKANKFFVAALHHRGGNYFQPEIWCRDEKAFRAESAHMYKH